MSEPCKHERLEDLDLCHNTDQWRVAWLAALDWHRDAISSFTAAVRAEVVAEKTLRRIDELVDVYDREGLDVPTSEIRVARNKEEK